MNISSPSHSHSHLIGLSLGLACAAFTNVASAGTETSFGYPVCTNPTTETVCYQDQPATAPYCAAGSLPDVVWNGPSSGGASHVVTTPHLFMLHLGSYWAGAGAATRAADVAAWTAIGTDARFWAPLEEYSPPGSPTMAPALNASGTIEFGSAVDTTFTTMSGNIADATVYAAIAADINRGNVAGTPIPSPTSQPGVVYVVRLPTGVGTVDCPLGATTSCGSYHTWISTSAGLADVAIITGSTNLEEGQNPYFSTAAFRGQDIVISHEVYEAVTDPQLTGYYTTFCGRTYQEVADLCETVVGDPIDGYTVSTLYSNANSGCVGPSNLDTTTQLPRLIGSCGPKNPDTLEQVCWTGGCTRTRFGEICPL